MIDFAALRQQVTMGQVLSHLGCLDELQARGSQRRGRCPIHSAAGERNRSFSANLEKNVFQCFHPDCCAKGNVLDLWAAVHHLPLREAAEHPLRRSTLTLPEQRRGTRLLNNRRSPNKPKKSDKNQASSRPTPLDIQRCI